MSPQEKAESLGVTFTRQQPGYLALVVRTGNLLITSGHVSDIKGKLGAGLSVEEGSVTFYLDPQEFHYNPLGTVHGGIISTMLDSAAACSVHTTLPAGIAYTSLDLNVKFLRAVTIASGRLTCTGQVLQKGRRTALAEARMTDAKGRLVAHATSSCLIFDAPAA